MSPRRLGTAAGLALGSALSLGGCSAMAPNSVVNGWSVGDVKTCNDARCAAQISVVMAAFEEYLPNHAPLTQLTIHEEGGYPRGDGTMAAPFRSGGCCDVALFQFADGMIYALGVGYLGISDEPVAVPRGREFIDPPQTPFRAE